MNSPAPRIEETKDGCRLYAVGQKGDVPMLTPRKQPLVLPSKKLAEALTREITGQKSYSPRNQPLTAIAYAAIDVVQNHRQLACGEVNMLAADHASHGR